MKEYTMQVARVTTEVKPAMPDGDVIEEGASATTDDGLIPGYGEVEIYEWVDGGFRLSGKHVDVFSVFSQPIAVGTRVMIDDHLGQWFVVVADCP